MFKRLTLVYWRHFFVTRLRKGGGYHLSLYFRYETSDSYYFLALEDRYESSLSIDSNNVTKNWILRIFVEKKPNFQFLPKILGIQGESEKSITFWVIFYEKLVLYLGKVSYDKLW